MDSVPNETWGEIAGHIALDIDKYCWRLVCKTFAACLPPPPCDPDMSHEFGKDRTALAALEHDTTEQIMVYTHHGSFESFAILCARGDRESPR